jgi:hypothetical protein
MYWCSCNFLTLYLYPTENSFSLMINVHVDHVLETKLIHFSKLDGSSESFELFNKLGHNEPMSKNDFNTVFKEMLLEHTKYQYLKILRS